MELICFRKHFLGRMLPARIVIILNHLRELNSSFDEIYYISGPVSHRNYLWWKQVYNEEIFGISQETKWVIYQIIGRKFSANIFLLKVNNRNTRGKVWNLFKGKVKTRERCHRHHSDVFVNFEHISHLVLLFTLLTLNKWFPPGLGSEKQNIQLLGEYLAFFHEKLFS